MLGSMMLLGVAACEQMVTVGAVFIDPAGAPVEGARVRCRCPDGNAGDHDVLSDAKGEFSHYHMPTIPESCTFVVEKEGFANKTLTTKDVLYTTGMLPENAVLPIVRLEPEPGRP